MAVSGILTVLVLGVIGVISYVSFEDGATLFAWHPTLMLTGVSRHFFGFSHTIWLSEM